MSQGKLGLTDFSDLVDFEFDSDNFANQEEDELSKMIRVSGIEMLSNPKSDIFSNSPKGVESITTLSESLNTKVPLRFRSVETPKVTKNKKVDTLKGLQPNVSNTRLLDKFNVLKQENENNRVGAKWFGKSNFEKDITIPLSRFLDKATTGIQEKKPMAPTVFKDDYLPLHKRITQEINEQKEKEKSEKKPKDAEPHRLKKECAENLLDVLAEGFRLWRNMEEEISQSMIDSLKESGHFDYIRSLATDPNKLAEEKENLNIFLTSIGPKRLPVLVKAVMDPKNGIESPELAGVIVNSIGAGEPTEIASYLKPYPKVLEEVCLGTLKDHLAKQKKETFFRNASQPTKLMNILMHSGSLKDFYSEAMNSVKGDVLELASFKKIDPKKPLDEETQKAYSKFLNKFVDKITADSLPKLALEYCKEIYATYFKLSNDQRAAKDYMVNFLILRVYSPMIVIDFPKVLEQLEKQAVANKQDTTELTNQKAAFKIHDKLVSKLLQCAANNTVPAEPNLHVLNPQIEIIKQRFVQLADQIMIRIQNEELQELPDDEERQEIEEEFLAEIVEYNNREFVIGKITTSNPYLWEDIDSFDSPKKRFCISTSKPDGIAEGNWNQGNQFCALMAVKWLSTRPQTLKLGDLSQQEQVEMANQLVESSMEQQVGVAVNLLKSQPTNTLSQSTSTRIGARIWMGNDRHVMAAEILANGMAKFYDPDHGTTETISTAELSLRAQGCNTIVASKA